MTEYELTDTGLAALIAAPLVWAAHFLASYATAAIWCAKAAGAERSSAGARSAIAIYTVAGLLAIGFIALRAYRSRRAAPAVAEDRDSAPARHRFLTFATLLLAGLSGIAIVYAALATALAGSCT
jgi:uncharacterized membrane protein YebE (DUF533 family)